MTSDQPKNSFNDLAGRVWLLVLNYGLAKRIAAELGVDFVNAHTGECFAKLADEALFVSVLFALCEAQAEKAGVTPEQFAEALAGEQFEAAGEALTECVQLFIRPALRPAFEQLIAAGRQERAASLELLSRKLQGAELQAAIGRRLAATSDQIDAALTGIS